IDVQKHLLYYVVTAWSDKFSGSVIDYGAWPGQSRPYFSLSEAHPTLQSASGSSQVEGAVYWGLQTLTDHLLHKKWQREGGGELTIGKAIIDANWSESTDTVYEFCRRSPFSGIVIPAHGKGLRAGDKPMIHYEKKTGEQLGFHWYLTFGSRQRAIRHCIHDVNFWKTFLAQRAAALAGEQGSLSMFGERSDQHRMFADHLAGESCERTFGRGREVWEWRARPNAENHWLDCLVMAGAAGSMLGATLENLSPAMKPPKPRRSLSAMQQARRRANWAMSGMR
ncbi:MAG: terminase gpA endonuclease subunit, partial [Planctomycetaceae bacterium]